MHGNVKDRLALRAFNLSLERNLELLADRLDNMTYAPSPAPKIYQPKTAGTLRTMPLLTVADRVVYQGICNIVAVRAKSDIQMVANRQVYAHLPASRQSMFPLRPWRVQYRQFTQSLEREWRRGSRWLVKADIASFYDSIDHGLLAETLRDRWGISDRLLDLLRECLHTWSPHVEQRYLDKGLPQGYEASDVLSTLFLNTVDRDMCGKGYDTAYHRYVDDMRILLSEEAKAQRALIDLDLSMKSVGLILQATKTTIRRVDSLDDQRDPLWGLLSYIGRSGELENGSTQPQLRQIFFDAVRSLTTNDFAESHLVFALHRLGPYEDVGDQVLLLLDRMPWRSYALTYYLRRFGSSHHIAMRLKLLLEGHRVYGWHLANLLRCLSEVARSEDVYPVCREWLLDARLPWYQRMVAAECLSQIPHSAAFCDVCSENEQHVLVKRALLSSSYMLATGDSTAQRDLLRRMLQDQNEQIQRIGIYFLLSHPELSWQDLTDCETSLESLGVLIPALSPQGECFIARTLADHFQVDGALTVNFADILGSDYDAARRHLLIAVGAHDTSPSRYVCRMDNLNVILTGGIYARRLPALSYQTNDPVNNWNRREFRDLCPVVAGAFLQ